MPCRTFYIKQHLKHLQDCGNEFKYSSFFISLSFFPRFNIDLLLKASLQQLKVYDFNKLTGVYLNIDIGFAPDLCVHPLTYKIASMCEFEISEKL